MNRSSWNDLTDLEKIRDVVEAASRPAPAHRPSYDYLVRFIDDIGSAYQQEVDLRKTLAKQGIILIMLMLFAIAVAIGLSLK